MKFWMLAIVNLGLFFQTFTAIPNRFYQYNEVPVHNPGDYEKFKLVVDEYVIPGKPKTEVMTTTLINPDIDTTMANFGWTLATAIMGTLLGLLLLGLCLYYCLRKRNKTSPMPIYQTPQPINRVYSDPCRNSNLYLNQQSQPKREMCCVEYENLTCHPTDLPVRHMC